MTDELTTKQLQQAAFNTHQKWLDLNNTRSYVPDSLEAYFHGLEDLDQAFNCGSLTSTVGCIDGGVAPFGVRIAGSGILLAKNFSLAVTETVKRLRDREITKITSHDCCGAGAVAAKRDEITDMPPDEYAIKFAKQVAQGLGIDYEHVPLVHRPTNLHTEGSAIISPIPFNPERLDGRMPYPFVISSGVLRRPQLIDHAVLAVNIALSDHGLGDLITPDHPFIIAFMHDDSHDQTLLDFEAVRMGLEQFGNRVLLQQVQIPERALRMAA